MSGWPIALCNEAGDIPGCLCVGRNIAPLVCFPVAVRDGEPDGISGRGWAGGVAPNAMSGCPGAECGGAFRVSFCVSASCEFVDCVAGRIWAENFTQNAMIRCLRAACNDPTDVFGRVNAACSDHSGMLGLSMQRAATHPTTTGDPMQRATSTPTRQVPLCSVQ